MNGVEHGTAIWYYRDGSKRIETPFVNGKEHGTEIGYREDGSKHKETVHENDKQISVKEWDKDGNLLE